MGSEGKRREGEGEATRRFRQPRQEHKTEGRQHIVLPRATLPAHEEREANQSEPAVLRSGRFPLVVHFGRLVARGSGDSAESPGTFPTAEREGKYTFASVRELR